MNKSIKKGIFLKNSKTASSIVTIRLTFASLG